MCAGKARKMPRHPDTIAVETRTAAGDTGQSPAMSAGAHLQVGREGAAEALTAAMTMEDRAAERGAILRAPRISIRRRRAPAMSRQPADRLMCHQRPGLAMSRRPPGRALSRQARGERPLRQPAPIILRAARLQIGSNSRRMFHRCRQARRTSNRLWRGLAMFHPGQPRIHNRRPSLSPRPNTRPDPRRHRLVHPGLRLRVQDRAISRRRAGDRSALACARGATRAGTSHFVDRKPGSKADLVPAPIPATARTGDQLSCFLFWGSPDCVTPPLFSSDGRWAPSFVPSYPPTGRPSS